MVRASPFKFVVLVYLLCLCSLNYLLHVTFVCNSSSSSSSSSLSSSFSSSSALKLREYWYSLSIFYFHTVIGTHFQRHSYGRKGGGGGEYRELTRATVCSPFRKAIELLHLCFVRSSLLNESKILDYYNLYHFLLCEHGSQLDTVTRVKLKFLAHFTLRV